MVGVHFNRAFFYKINHVGCVFWTLILTLTLLFVSTSFKLYKRLSEDRGISLVGAILSKVVPATFSTIASFSKMIWRSEQTPTKKPEPKPQSFARGENNFL